MHHTRKKGAVVLRKNLIKERKNKNSTQNEMSKLLDISTRHYKSLEAGASDGSVKLWQQLSKLFNVTIDYLLEQEADDNLTTK